MTAVQSIRPRRPLAHRMANFWGKWLVASPLAVVAVAALSATVPPHAEPTTPLAYLVVFAFFSVFSAGLGYVLASGADPDFREDSSPAQMARALYLIAPGWIVANAISWAWAIFISLGVLGIVVAGWRTLLH